MARLLIVEDDDRVGQLYREEFESEGYEVELARDGAAALERLSAFAPDAIVLDIGLPEKSGLDVLEEMGAAAGRTPVIVNTAYPLFRFDLRAHRAAVWVNKSSNLDLLKQHVRRLTTPKENGIPETH